MRPARPTVAAFDIRGLRAIVASVHAELRSRGVENPRLPEPPAVDLAAALDQTREAATTTLAELKPTNSNRELIERAIGVLAATGDGEPNLDELCGLCTTSGAKPMAAYREAIDAAVCRAAEAGEGGIAYRHVGELLQTFSKRFAAAKERRAALDFEDLQLLARDLLVADAGLREHFASRFTHVLVDEYQDVNPLQSELIELIAPGKLFRVGDENQSIYGFRHADVSVFRTHRERAVAEGRAASITVNFRTRGEVLDAIDLAFERTFGEAFEPLREAPGARGQRPGGPAVELLAVHRDPQAWEEALARPATLASTMEAVGVARWPVLQRIDELTREGEVDWGDVVILLRATTSMSVYERALEERGVPTHVVGGRGYWSQQQVLDLRHWLAASGQPAGRAVALLGARVAPGGTRARPVALVARCARRERRDPLWTIRGALDEGEGHWLAQVLPAADWKRLRTFVSRFDAERGAATRVALETLIDRAVTSTGYDRHLLSLHQGERRMANVRKLMRMAREYEADEGRDLRGFIDAVSERDVIQTREGEAPLEGEALNAVRLMTIHRAKGLEFPVVAVPQLSRRLLVASRSPMLTIGHEAESICARRDAVAPPRSRPGQALLPPRALRGPAASRSRGGAPPLPRRDDPSSRAADPQRCGRARADRRHGARDAGGGADLDGVRNRPPE